MNIKMEKAVSNFVHPLTFYILILNLIIASKLVFKNQQIQLFSDNFVWHSLASLCAVLIWPSVMPRLRTPSSVNKNSILNHFCDPYRAKMFFSFESSSKVHFRFFPAIFSRKKSGKVAFFQEKKWRFQRVQAVHSDPRNVRNGQKTIFSLIFPTNLF